MESIEMIRETAPTAYAAGIPIQKIPDTYMPLTTWVEFREEVDGVPMIERFATDQADRDFYIGYQGFRAEVWVHKRHLVDKYVQKLQAQRTKKAK